MIALRLNDCITMFKDCYAFEVRYVSRILGGTCIYRDASRKPTVAEASEGCCCHQAPKILLTPRRLRLLHSLVQLDQDEARNDLAIAQF